MHRDGETEESHVEASHGPVGPRQRAQTELSGQRIHVVEQGDEAWSFHDSPGPFPRKIESRLDGGLALRVVVNEPLDAGYDGKELPEVVDDNPILARRRKQTRNENHC